MAKQQGITQEQIKQLEEFSKTLDKGKAEIYREATTDSAFRKKLQADPGPAIEEKYDLPKGTLDGLEFKVVVDDPGTMHLPIGPDTSNMELSDDQLAVVAGGEAIVALALIAVGGTLGVAAIGAVVVGIESGLYGGGGK